MHHIRTYRQQQIDCRHHNQEVTPAINRVSVDEGKVVLRLCKIPIGGERLFEVYNAVPDIAEMIIRSARQIVKVAIVEAQEAALSIIIHGEELVVPSQLEPAAHQEIPCYIKKDVSPLGSFAVADALLRVHSVQALHFQNNGEQKRRICPEHDIQQLDAPGVVVVQQVVVRQLRIHA